MLNTAAKILFLPADFETIYRTYLTFPALYVLAKFGKDGERGSML